MVQAPTETPVAPEAPVARRTRQHPETTQLSPPPPTTSQAAFVPSTFPDETEGVGRNGGRLAVPVLPTKEPSPGPSDTTRKVS